MNASCIACVSPSHSSSTLDGSVHGQFEAVSGDRDRGLYDSPLLDRAPLLTSEAQ